MEPYSRYLEDKCFIDWVFDPTPESNTFWESYIKSNPEEKEIVYALKKILLGLKTNDAIISNEEKQEVLEQILSKTNSAKTSKVKTLPGFIKRYYKYAAIFIVIITASIFINKNFVQNKKLPFSDINLTALDSITSTQLNLASGEQLLIKEAKSTIEYNDLGNIILNESDTINKNIAYSNSEKESLNTLIIPYGRHSKITLSDGTIVHLNAGTQFVFPEKFIGDKRTVFLSGEAFFEVTSNKEKPFIVKTIVEELLVEVLGTKFNVSAYPSDKEVLTVLTEGKVNVVEENILNDNKTVLKPGQLAAWNKDAESIKVKDVNTDNYTLWTQGLLYFESEPMANVIKKLERFYNIELTFDESTNKLYSTSISGKLDLNDNLKRTLENLEATAELNFEKINNRKYMIK
ncbi:FecR family protein [Jejuia spongiicola]|uniref:FecR domain-containing protein n=1 Tax=Jejuia spongiicola TaxID=2942207 RepID=A0ABT0QFM9_9FLAO|nr:FecR domain-containing protein [Jejuia spongiicola]MCL6295797.1 FecR domain-containing protein [Jejuia spongiicola]